MTQNYGNSAGGGRSKRLGVATLSGLLAVGLTPAFVTPAFAGAELGESENVVTLNGTDKLSIAAATATNTGLPSSDPDTKFDAKFNEVYQLVLKASKENKPGCAKTDPADGKTIDYAASNPTGTAKTTAATDVLTFTPQASNGSVDCTYTIEQTKKGADDKLRAGWEPDKAVYTFKVKATTSDGTSGTKMVKVADADDSVAAGKIKLLKDSNPATEGLVFKNTFSGVAFAKGDGTWKDNSINADYAIVPVAEGTEFKVPEITDPANKALVGWKLKDGDPADKVYTSEEIQKTHKPGQVYTAQYATKIVFKNSDDSTAAEFTGEAGGKIDSKKVPAASDDLCMTKKTHFLGWQKNNAGDLITSFVDEGGKDKVEVDATAANNNFKAICSAPVSQELKGTKTATGGATVPEGVFQVELSAKTKDCPLPKDEKGQPKTTAPITKNTTSGAYEFNFGNVTFEKLQKCVYTFTEQAVNGQELEASKWGLADPVEKTLETEYTGGQFKVKVGYADPTFQNTAPVKVTFQAGENGVNFKDNSHEKEVFDKAGALGLKAAVAEIEKQLNPPADMKLENFAGWKDSTGNVVEIGDKFPDDSTKVYTAVWSKDVEVKFYKAKTKDSDTPVLLGTQKLPAGKLLGKLAKNDKGQDVDLTVADNVCAAKGQALTGWSEKAAPGTKDLVLSAQNAAADKEYTAQCGKAEVTFTGGQFAAGTNNEKTEQVVPINLGKNGVYDGDKHVDDSVTVPAVTVTDDKKADGEHLKGWKLNDTDTIYSPDLKTIVSDGKDEAYKPVAGDKLTAVFGFKVVFHASGTDNKIGDPVGTEIVEKNKNAAGKFVSDVKVCTTGTHTSKWYVVTDNAKSSTVFTLGDAGSNVDADKEIVADCVDGATATITLKANGGQFKTDAQKLDINHYSMDNSGLVYTGPVIDGAPLKMTAPNGDDVLEARAGYKFAGWYPKPDGTGTKFSDRGEDLTANQVFYAKWEEQKPVKVTVLNHLGKASGIPAVEVKYNDLAKLDGVDNTKVCPEGKTVSGWVNTADSKNFDTTKPVTADVILRAVCDSTPETVTVSFVDAADKAINGADDKPVVYTVKYNTALTADQKAPEGKDAYCESVKDTTPLFDKWMADGKDFDPAMKFTKDTVVKAACKPAAKKIKVTLNSDKPESLGEMEYTDADTVAKITVPEGKQACTTEAAPQLNGWYQTSDNTKTKLADETPLVDGMNLTALCGAKTHATVTFKYGDNKTKTVSVELNKAIDKAEIPTEGLCVEGKEFKGWSDEAALKAPVTNDLELTAKCEAKTTPGGSTGGSTGGSSSGGSYFGGGSGGSSTPSTPAKDKKPGDKKPGDKKPGAKQPVVNKFDKQFTKKVELPKSAVKRAAGADRVATSVAALSLAKNHEVVVLATGSNFPDALVGGALAGAYKAGVVLTTGATLEQSVLDSLKSYKTKTVHIVGGNGAVSLAKEAQLRAAGLQVVRHAGADRYATAQAVKAATLKALGGKSAISCNATGSNFPDALACSSAASQMGGVVDLVKPGTAVAKDATAKTVCAGGPACQAAGAGVDKVVGSDRYETAYKLAEMTPAKGSVLVSNGQSYADSLVAGALAGSLQADLVLAKPSRVNVPAGTKSAQLFGGTTVLPDSLSMYTK